METWLLPPLIPAIDGVAEAKLMGVIFADLYNFDNHVKSVLSRCSQRLYAIHLRPGQGLNLHGLSTIFEALVLSRISYAISAWGGFIHKSLADQIDAFRLRNIRLGVFNRPLTFNELLNKFDNILYSIKLLHLEITVLLNSY